MNDLVSIADCFICNAPTSTLVQSSVPVFGDKAVLPSDAKLQDIISEIIGRAVDEATYAGAIICKKCYQNCDEFDSMHKRLNKIRNNLTGEFEKGSKDIADLTSNESPRKREPVQQSPKMEFKKLILPKSKMKPVPADMLMAMQNNSNKGIKNNLFVSPSKLLLSPGTSLIKPQMRLPQSPLKLVPNVTTSVRSLSDLLSELDTTVHINETGKVKPSSASTTPIRDFNSIFEDHIISQSKRFKSEDISSNTILDEITGAVTKKLPSPMNKTRGDGANIDEKYVIGEVEILEENDLVVDDDTILMEQDESGAIIRVVRGSEKHLLFSNADDGNVDAEQNASDLIKQFKVEDQDSNDPLELQMSGDEETARAIVDAARQHGATYIKMNGAMYRVGPVESETQKPATPKTLPETAATMVEKCGDMIYRCKVCKDSFVSDARTIMRHVSVQHKARITICLLCGAGPLNSVAEYTNHMKAAHAEFDKQLTERTKQHECTICKKKFISTNLLSEHMQRHAGEKRYPCQVCPKAFSSKYSYHAHLKIHTDRPRPHTCDTCHKSFFTLHNLNQHLVTHAGLKTHECDTCNKKFATQHNLEMHKVVHTGLKPFICGVCEKAFARRAEIKDHMRVHTGERPYQCDMCPLSFAQNSNLLTHRRIKHLQDKRYNCEVCGKAFKRRRLMDYHIKSCHTGERPHKCEICTATFVYPEHYKKHLRIHSGDRPHVCEVCGKTFNSRDNRNAHRFVHSNKKPYECLTCGMGFMRKPQLYTHMEQLPSHRSETIIVNQPHLNVDNLGVDPEEVSDAVVLVSHKPLRLSGTAAPRMTEAFDSKDSVKSEMQPESNPSQMFFVRGEDKASVSLVQQGANGQSLLMLDGSLMSAGGDESEGIDDSQLQLLAQQESAIVDEHGNVVRLVQIELADGKNGWVVLDPDE